MPRLGSAFLVLEDRHTPTSFGVLIGNAYAVPPDPAPQTREHVLLARQTGVAAPAADTAAYKPLAYVRYGSI